MKKVFYGFLAILIFGFFKAEVGAVDTSDQKVVKDIDYLYMYANLPMSYKLPDKFRKEQLKFSGNYKKNTKAEYRPQQNDILFTPFKNGSSVMVIKNKRNKILTRISLSIQKNNLHKVAAEVRDLLVTVDGIEIRIYNNKVIVDGQVMLPVEMDRIAKVVSDYGNKVVRSFVSYSPKAQKRIAELIESEIEYPEVEIKYAYNRFLLQGCVNTIEEKRRAISIATLYTQFEVNPIGKGAQKRDVPVLNDNLKVPCESVKKDEEDEKNKKSINKLIQVVVHFVEMSKSFNKSFLFQFSPAIRDNQTQVTGQISTTSGPGYSTNISATVGNFFPKLNWAKRFNFARVLHNSSLLMENTVAGTIETVTTVPPASEKQSSPVNAQVVVNVKPTITGPSDNMIQLEIEVNVASPEGEGRTTNKKIQTTINVRDGSSAVIGGLTSSFLVQEYNNAPDRPKNAIPILDLYSSKGYSNQKSQFVVFITPLIKSSASIGVDRIKEKFRVDN